MFLFVVVLWVGVSVYLTYTEVPIKGELLGFEIDFIATRVDEDLGLEEDTRVVIDFTHPIEPSFETEGLENVAERIEEELIVEPQVFHDLQSDAVLEEEDIEESDLEDHLDFLDDDFVVDFSDEESPEDIEDDIDIEQDALPAGL